MPPKLIVKRTRFQSLVNAFLENSFFEKKDDVEYWSWLPQAILMEICAFLGILLTGRELEWQGLFCGIVHHVVQPVEDLFPERTFKKFDLSTTFGTGVLRSRFSLDLTQTRQMFPIVLEQYGRTEVRGYFELSQSFLDFFREHQIGDMSWDLYCLTFGYCSFYRYSKFADGLYGDAHTKFYDRFRNYALIYNPRELDVDYYDQTVDLRSRFFCVGLRCTRMIHLECSKRTALSISGLYDSSVGARPERLSFAQDHYHIHKFYWNYIFQVRSVEVILAINGHTALCRKFDGTYIKLPVRAFYMENLVQLFKDHMVVRVDFRPKLILDMYPNRKLPVSGLVLNLKHFIKPFQKPVPLLNK